MDTSLLPTARRPLARRRGFSLAEMMVVIVIIGLLVTLVVPNVLKKFGQATRGKAKADITSITSALEDYYINNNGTWPDSLEALVTPDDNGQTYLNRRTIPLDPWKNEYGYEPPGGGESRPRVFTLGKDGVVGGMGDDGDMDNWMIQDGEV